MEEHIKLRLEYKKLIRNGKKTEAQKVLKKIWAKSGKSIRPAKKEIITEAKEVKKKVKKIFKLEDLSLINGIGKKTVEDICLIFDNLSDLRNAIINNKVPLRDDIVIILKEELF